MNPAAVPVFVRSNRELHDAQIHSCLATIASLTNCLRVAAGGTDEAPFGPDYATEKEKNKSLDTNARAALELSLGKACSRLDGLLDDPSRWNLPEKDSHTLAIQYFSQSIIAQQQINESTALQLRSLQERLNEEAGVRRVLLQATLNKGLAEIGVGSDKPLTSKKRTSQE